MLDSMNTIFIVGVLLFFIPPFCLLIFSVLPKLKTTTKDTKKTEPNEKLNNDTNYVLNDKSAKNSDNKSIKKVSCNFCGKEIDEDSQFCKHCGALQ